MICERKRTLAIGLLAGILLSIETPVRAATKATPTPTPQLRKLAGGFGREAPDTVVTPEVVATPAPGESLAERVRAADKGRKRKESKATVAITNETLVTDPRKGKLTTSSPRATSPSPTPGPLTPGPELTRPAPAVGEEAKAEAYWRERMNSARSRVEDLRERVRRFELESKKLENDFYTWDDGQYRDGVIKPAWDRKREELETARRDLEQAEKELAELPELARRAGALPGWLRE